MRSLMIPDIRNASNRLRNDVVNHSCAIKVMPPVAEIFRFTIFRILFFADYTDTVNCPWLASSSHLHGYGCASNSNDKQQ